VTLNYPVWQIVLTIIQLILTIAVLWSSRNKVTNDRFTQLENSKLEQDMEIKHLKQKLREQRPACDNHGRMEENDKIIFHRLESFHKDIADIKSSVGKIEGGLDGIKHTGQLINEFLLNQGGKK
jgi:hypothetical protein